MMRREKYYSVPFERVGESLITAPGYQTLAVRLSCTTLARMPKLTSPYRDENK